MSKLETTLEVVRGRYSSLIPRFVKALEGSSSRERVDCDPSKFRWYFVWGVQLKSGDREVRGSVEKRVRDVLGRCFVSLEARKGRWSSSITIKPPKELREYYRVAYRRQDAEIAAFKALSQDEQDRQIGDGLRKLRRMGGFVEVRL